MRGKNPFCKCIYIKIVFGYNINIRGGEVMYEYKDAMGIVQDMKEELEELRDEFSQHYWCNHTDKLDKINDMLDKVNRLDEIIFSNK